MSRAIAGALGVFAIALAIASAIALALTACTPSPEAAPSAPASTAPVRPTPSLEVPVAAATPTPARPSVPPVRVVAASIGVDIPVIPVGIEKGGFMELPANPATAGWYRYGPDPASTDGNTVISAHVDAPDYPIGPFSALRDLKGGAVIQVTDAAGTEHSYTVQSVTYYRKTELPVHDLFARSGGKALVLITCGGDYDSRIGRYTDNVVAIATPVG